MSLIKINSAIVTIIRNFQCVRKLRFTLSQENYLIEEQKTLASLELKSDWDNKRKWNESFFRGIRCQNLHIKKPFLAFTRFFLVWIRALCDSAKRKPSNKSFFLFTPLSYYFFDCLCVLPLKASFSPLTYKYCFS